MAAAAAAAEVAAVAAAELAAAVMGRTAVSLRHACLSGQPRVCD